MLMLCSFIFRNSLKTVFQTCCIFFLIKVNEGLSDYDLSHCFPLKNIFDVGMVCLNMKLMSRCQSVVQIMRSSVSL